MTENDICVEFDELDELPDETPEQLYQRGYSLGYRDGLLIAVCNIIVFLEKAEEGLKDWGYGPDVREQRVRASKVGEIRYGPDVREQRVRAKWEKSRISYLIITLLSHSLFASAQHYHIISSSLFGFQQVINDSTGFILLQSLLHLYCRTRDPLLDHIT